jgi:hypothetical protein
MSAGRRSVGAARAARLVSDGIAEDSPRSPSLVNSSTHAKIVSFIWGIADDVLRDLYVRGTYRDVILPFTVLRRLDRSTADLVTAAAERDDVRLVDLDVLYGAQG